MEAEGYKWLDPNEKTREASVVDAVYKGVNYGIRCDSLDQAEFFLSQHIEVMDHYVAQGEPKDSALFQGLLRAFKLLISEKELQEAKLQLPEGYIWSTYTAK